MTAPLLSPSIGPFRLLRRIGAGGMAETFLAERAGPVGVTQKVCLKTILAEPSNMELLLRSFENEMRIGAKLRHNALVQQLDCGVDGETLWIALEFIDGIDLRKLLNACRMRGESLPPRLVPYVVSEVLGALDYLHRLSDDGTPLRIVHRDVSPANVLLSREGEVKLADFGIARAYADVDGAQTSTGMLKGKFPYMSPEQAVGAPLDARSDLFTMGTMTFELYARVRPFDGDSDLSTLANVRDGDGQSLRAAAPGLDEWVYEFVDKLLAHDPAKRFQTAAEAMRAIPAQHVTRAHRDELAALVASAMVPPAKPSEPMDRGADAEGATLLSTETLAPAPEPLQATLLFETPSSQAGVGHLPTISAATTPRAQGASSTAPEPQHSATRKHRRALAIGASLLAFGAIAAAWGTWARGGDGKTDAPPPSGSPVATVSRPEALAPAPAPSSPSPDPPPPQAPPSPPVEERADVPSTSPGEATPTPAPRGDTELATVRVQAVPWGSVWIDGRKVGEGTVRRELSPGRHSIAVGLDAPQAARVVVLRPGEEKVLSLRVN